MELSLGHMGLEENQGQPESWVCGRQPGNKGSWLEQVEGLVQSEAFRLDPEGSASHQRLLGRGVT